MNILIDFLHTHHCTALVNRVSTFFFRVTRYTYVKNLVVYIFLINITTKL